MDLDSVSVHKHAKKELGQYPAILTSHLVNNPYILYDSRPIYHRQSTEYRPSVGRYIDRDIGRRSTDTSTDVSVDISTDISTDISRSKHRSSVGRYVGRYISTDTSVEGCTKYTWSKYSPGKTSGLCSLLSHVTSHFYENLVTEIRCFFFIMVSFFPFYETFIKVITFFPDFFYVIKVFKSKTGDLRCPFWNVQHHLLWYE